MFRRLLPEIDCTLTRRRRGDTPMRHTVSGGAIFLIVVLAALLLLTVPPAVEAATVPAYSVRSDAVADSATIAYSLASGGLAYHGTAARPTTTADTTGYTLVIPTGSFETLIPDATQQQQQEPPALELRTIRLASLSAVPHGAAAGSSPIAEVSYSYVNSSSDSDPRQPMLTVTIPISIQSAEATDALSSMPTDVDTLVLQLVADNAAGSNSALTGVPPLRPLRNGDRCLELPTSQNASRVYLRQRLWTVSAFTASKVAAAIGAPSAIDSFSTVVSETAFAVSTPERWMTREERTPFRQVTKAQLSLGRRPSTVVRDADSALANVALEASVQFLGLLTATIAVLIGMLLLQRVVAVGEGERWCPEKGVVDYAFGAEQPEDEPPLTLDDDERTATVDSGIWSEEGADSSSEGSYDEDEEEDEGDEEGEDDDDDDEYALVH